MDINLEKYYPILMDFIVKYGTSLIIVLFAWWLGSKVIRFCVSLISNQINKSNMDETLKPFLKALIRSALYALLVITIMGTLGIEMSSVIAVLGAAGLAFGLALSGTLQNFAGGFILLIFKPFRVGNVIETQGLIGTVSAIRIFHTDLITADNRKIIMPNGGLASAVIININAESLRRVDWEFCVTHTSDITKAKEILLNLAQQDKRILKNPAFFIAISGITKDAIEITTRAWVNNKDYWSVLFDTNEQVQQLFLKAEISLHIPQLAISNAPTKKVTKRKTKASTK